jgi:hypothetical protein
MFRLVLVLAASAWAVAAAPPAQPPVNRISIPAWIESEDPAPAPKFEATLNARNAAIHSQLGPESDQIILVVLDLTGDLAYIDPAREALASEISKLPRNAWVGLLHAQDGLHVLADPGPDRRPALEGIENLSNSGHPGLLETVHSALTLADGMLQKAPVRVSVLYITDSNIYNYREDFTNPVINLSDPHDLSRRFPEALIEEKIARLTDAAATLQAPLFVVHLHDRGNRLNRAYENGLQSLAGSTGGQANICRSVAEIPESIAAAFARIASQWRLILTVPPKVHGLGYVRLSGRSGETELRLSWRSRLETRETSSSGNRPKRSHSGL